MFNGKTHYFYGHVQTIWTAGQKKQKSPKGAGRKVAESFRGALGGDGALSGDGDGDIIPNFCWRVFTGLNQDYDGFIMD